MNIFIHQRKLVTSHVRTSFLLVPPCLRGLKILIIGNIRAKFSNWSTNDRTTAAGAQLLDCLTELYSIKQIITEPTHIWQIKFSYSDLSFLISITTLWILGCI